MLRRAIDLQHPWFIPLYRRVIVVAICLSLTLIDAVFGDPFWMTLFGALTAYCIYSFFFAFTPREPEE